MQIHNHGNDQLAPTDAYIIKTTVCSLLSLAILCQIAEMNI